MFLLKHIKAKYISLFDCMKDSMPLMELVTELYENNYYFLQESPHVFCYVIDVNSGALEVVCMQKKQQYIKHINLCDYYFWEHVS